MYTFLVTLFLDQDSGTVRDLELAEFVESVDGVDVVEKAKHLASAKYPSLNIAEASIWAVGKFGSLEAAKPSCRSGGNIVASV